MIVGSYKINAFTDLSEDICVKVLDLLQKEYGEIGHFLIEDDEVSFQVYKCYYEGTQKNIKSVDNKIKLNLIDRFDDPFYSLAYKITLYNF